MGEQVYEGLEAPVLALDVIPQILGYPPRTVLELGANTGSDTFRLLAAFPEATIHCFEPDPRAYAQLERDLHGTRARFYPLAVAASDGPLTFHQSTGDAPWVDTPIPGGWNQSGSIHAPKTHLVAYDWCRFETTITVEGVALDSWADRRSIRDVDFIWADLQGAEHDLIRGGRHVLERTRLLYTEYSDHELYEGQLPLHRLLEMLPGWSILRQYPGDVLLQNMRPRVSA